MSTTESKPGELLLFERLRDGSGLIFRHVEENTYGVEHGGTRTLVGTYDVALDEFKRLSQRWGYA